MDLIDRQVRTWVASGQDHEIRETVSAISDGRAALLDVVKALGEYLTSEEDELRTKGVEFLSRVVVECSPDKMNRQSARVLATFMCSKLEDPETIIPALKGLVSLVSQPSFTSVDAVDVINAMFKYVKMRALVQSQRFMVFTIVDALVARQRDALRNMDREFLDGYIALAEGEKDPRNLLLAFAIARVLLIEFDVTHHVEHLFNITFCYFPITFRPPPDDPYGITTEDLKKALRDCLSATPAFGLLAVPLFLEKLTAGSPVTKRDTLQTLRICFPIYGASVARNNAKKLWNAFKLEIFQPTDIETENLALKATQVLIQTIYSATDVVSKDEEIEGLAKDACEECIRILKEPEKSQAKPAIKVLSAFVSTTPSVSKFTLAQAIPHLVGIFLNRDEVQNRAPTLQLLSDLVEAARDSKLDDSNPEEIPLAPYKDEVLGAFTVGLKNTSTCVHAIAGLNGLVSTPGLLTDEELGFVVHNLNEVLTGGAAEENEDVSDAIINLLTNISSSAPRHVSQTTLPLLFNSLPDRAPPREAEPDRLKYWRMLSFLKRLCLQPDLFEMLVVRLSTKLDLVCFGTKVDGITEVDSEPGAAYAHSILRTLADVIAKKVDLGHSDVVKYLDRMVPKLYNLHIYSALVSQGDYVIASDPRLVSVSAEIVTLVVQTLPAQRQESFLASLLAAYIEGEATRIAQGQQKIPEDRKFAPFDLSAPTVQKNLVLLFSAGLIALRKDVALPVDNESVFLERLLDWSINQTESVSQRDAVFHALASLLNKRADVYSTFLTDRSDHFWSSQVANASLQTETRKKAISAWTWMTKALLVRGHNLAQSFTDRFFELFDDPDMNWEAARAIGKIVSPDKILTKKNHAVAKFLFAQKFSNAMLPRIIEGAKSSSQSRLQNAYLVALTSLIKSIPKTAYAHEMPTLMPLLLRGLDLPDQEIRANVIDTLLTVADTSSKDNSAVTEHAASLVSTMLRNSTVHEMPSIRVRTAALRYLAILPSLVRYDVLHPHKAAVLRDLAKVLDDPKRAVRKEAVEARTNWYKFTG